MFSKLNLWGVCGACIPKSCNLCHFIYLLFAARHLLRQCAVIFFGSNLCAFQICDRIVGSYVLNLCGMLGCVRVSLKSHRRFGQNWTLSKIMTTHKCMCFSSSWRRVRALCDLELSTAAKPCAHRYPLSSEWIEHSGVSINMSQFH